EVSRLPTASAAVNTTPITVSVAARARVSSAHTSRAPKNSIASAPRIGCRWSASATPMPGSATWERASAARAIRRISAKQATRPAATAMATGSANASGLMDVVIHGRPVHLVEDVGREDRPRRPQARLAPAQAQHGGRVPVDDGQLVRDEEDREPLLLLEAPRQ